MPVWKEKILTTSLVQITKFSPFRISLWHLFFSVCIWIATDMNTWMTSLQHSNREKRWVKDKIETFSYHHGRQFIPLIHKNSENEFQLELWDMERKSLKNNLQFSLMLPALNTHTVGWLILRIVAWKYVTLWNRWRERNQTESSWTFTYGKYVSNFM